MHEHVNTSVQSVHLKVDHCDALERVEEARHLFQRTLAKWAGDMLVLRSQSIQGPRWPELADPSLLDRAA